jgi:hypothetical protein
MCGVVILLVIAIAVIPVFGQRQKIAIFLQAAVPVPTGQLEVLKSFANQRCAIVTGAGVCSAGELMYAQRLTETYIGNSISLEGMRGDLLSQPIASVTHKPLGSSIWPR